MGPDLVRSAAIEHGTIELTGDWSNTTDLEVFASSSVSQVRFNGEAVRVSRTSYGSLVGNLEGCTQSTGSIQAQLPQLKSWKVNDGLPERDASYDDSKWVGMVRLLTHHEHPADLRSCQSQQYPKSNSTSHISCSLRRRVW
jgi:hypothetical protein